MGCPAEATIGDNLVFSITTHDPDTGVLTDADAAPVWRLYEDETDAPILNGTMAKLDDANTTGFYTELVACTTGNGFENGKTYTIYIEATVDSDKGGISYGFKAITGAGEIADAVWEELKADHTGATKFGGALQDFYHADIHYQRDDDETKDRYVARWYKNGVRITSGITVPVISVYDLTDGSTLINSETMSDVGSGMLLYAEQTDRQTLGTPYEAVITATIDGASRSFSKDLGRDV